MLLLKQTIPQKKVLILCFLETESLKMWHYQEDTTPARCRNTFCTPHPPMLFAMSKHGAFLVMPHHLTLCLKKAELESFLLKYRLFLY